MPTLPAKFSSGYALVNSRAGCVLEDFMRGRLPKITAAPMALAASFDIGCTCCRAWSRRWRREARRAIRGWALAGRSVPHRRRAARRRRAAVPAPSAAAPGERLGHLAPPEAAAGPVLGMPKSCAIAMLRQCCCKTDYTLLRMPFRSLVVSDQSMVPDRLTGKTACLLWQGPVGVTVPFSLALARPPLVPSAALRVHRPQVPHDGGRPRHTLPQQALQGPVHSLRLQQVCQGRRLFALACSKFLGSMVTWKHGRYRRSCLSWAEHTPRCSEWSRPHRCSGDDGCDALLQFDLGSLLSESNQKGAQTPACPAGWNATGRAATCSTPTRSPSRTASRSSRMSRRQTPRPLTRRPVASARRNRPAAATGAPRWCSFPAWTPHGHSMRRPRPSR